MGLLTGGEKARKKSFMTRKTGACRDSGEGVAGGVGRRVSSWGRVFPEETRKGAAGERVATEAVKQRGAG